MYRIFMLQFLFLFSPLGASDLFDYTKTDADKIALWAFFDETGHGFTFLPYTIDGKLNIDQIHNDVLKLRQKLKENIIRPETARIALIKTLSDNPCGFLYYCLAFGRSDRKTELVETLRTMFSDDPEKNFMILYGLRVTTIETKEFPEDYCRAMERAVAASEGKPVKKTIFLPDIKSAIKKTSESLNNQFTRQPTKK